MGKEEFGLRLRIAWLQKRAAELEEQQTGGSRTKVASGIICHALPATGTSPVLLVPLKRGKPAVRRNN